MEGERPAARRPHAVELDRPARQAQASARSCARVKVFGSAPAHADLSFFETLFRSMSDADPPPARPPYIVVGRAGAAGPQARRPQVGGDRIVMD